MPVRLPFEQIRGKIYQWKAGKSMKYLSLASGSSGNCHYIEKHGTKILVDVGLSGKAAEQGLSFHGLDLSKVQAIFITHEHADHIKGAGIVSRRYDIPIYATKGTWQAIGDSLGKIKEKNCRIFEKNTAADFGDLRLFPFETSHDAKDPCGFLFTDGQQKLAIATDLGCVTSRVEHAVLSSDLVVLEANHDVEMLKMGSYPYHLKRRVLSDCGHLSNETAGEFAVDLVCSGTKAILLAHLSGENNHPLLAYETVASRMKISLIRVQKDIRLSVLERGRPSNLIDLRLL